MKLLQEIYCCI